MRPLLCFSAERYGFHPNSNESSDDEDSNGSNIFMGSGVTQVSGFTKEATETAKKSSQEVLSFAILQGISNSFEIKDQTFDIRRFIFR